MIVQNQKAVSQATLATAAQLVTEVMMRLTNNGVNGFVNGNAVTRASIGASALAAASKELRKL